MEGGPGDSAADDWFPGILAAALRIGIGKRELLEDYYLDELAPLFRAYAALDSPAQQEESGFADELW